MSPYTLIVIDMQPGFDTNHPKLISKVSEEIVAAKKANADIIFLEFWKKLVNGAEYNQYGDTLPQLLKLVEYYQKSTVLRKYECSGEMSVCNFLNNNQTWNRTKFRVCGVCTDMCVQETVLDLCERLPNIEMEVVVGACWTPNKAYIESVEKLPEIPKTPFDNPFYFFRKYDKIIYK